jgi:hypothetical protein
MLAESQLQLVIVEVWARLAVHLNRFLDVVEVTFLADVAKILPGGDSVKYFNTIIGELAWILAIENRMSYIMIVSES